MAGINSRNAGKALLTSLLLSGAIILDTSNALAQTVGENFSKKNLKKFERTYDKKFKDDAKTIKAGETYKMSPAKVTKMYDDESDYMIYEVLPNLVVDHTVLKQFNLSGLQINNILDFLLYGEGHDKYYPIAKGLVDKLLAYETGDKISNMIKFPFGIPTEYTNSLGPDYKDQAKIIDETFVKGLPEFQKQLEKGSTQVWFADTAAWAKFKTDNPKILDYVVKMKKTKNKEGQTSWSPAKAGEAGEEFVPTPNDDLKGGKVVINFDLKNTTTEGEGKKFIDKTSEQTNIMYQVVYRKFLQAKYKQYKTIIPKIAKDATIDNNGK